MFNTSTFIDFYYCLKHFLFYSLLRLSAFFAGPPGKLAEAFYNLLSGNLFSGSREEFLGRDGYLAIEFLFSW